MSEANDDVLGVRRPEREMLRGFRDWYEQVIVNKVEGLSLELASKVMTPSGMSALGVVKHLAWVEAGWFREKFADEPDFREVSNPESFVLTPDDTIESVVGEYRAECARSNEIIEGAVSLDMLSARPWELGGNVTLRWIILHMLEETARHAGHLDFMREHLDGTTGD